MLALSACGPEEISSPGTGGDVIINPSPTPTPGPTPTPTPTPTGSVTAASECPTISDPAGLTDSGVINVPQGTVRVCTLPARINASSTLPYTSGVAYRMNGRVDVGTDGGFAASASDTNVTLTIEPGVVVYAGTGVSYLVVNRGNKINAEGTATNPIIFTSEQNILGNTSDTDQGQWGGVVLLGRGKITDCDTGTAASESNTSATNSCQRDTEGASDPALFGGNNDSDSSGTMKYVQIRYSGYVLSSDNELQSLTLGGVGSGTVMENIMSFNSSDDAIEAFGGDIRAKNLVLIGADDDNLDTDTGVRGFIQYVLAVQRNGAGDAMIEADSNNSNIADLPRQDIVVSNATFVQRDSGSDLAAMLIRGAADYTLLNSVVYAPTYACLRISLPETLRAADATIDENGPPQFRSVVMTCQTPFIVNSNGSDGNTAADVEAAFGSGSNNNDANFTSSLLLTTFANGSNENAVAVTNPTSYSSFFTNPAHIGAVFTGYDSWYKGWTCDSTAADLGAGKSCASSPVT
ncbi:hypothetical protein GRI39_02955 [Altererythrobacter indicus]|uniref:Lipoprotein n=1 Tax=Altericroceibacterium indicum TaxID=374177 RepID=A0A845A625_9SPHN|nr:hypothetical protein [Altericroceibacterium indicum]MXP25007.1 hypothetical protein [Altericroceibacterium indicum]